MWFCSVAFLLSAYFSEDGRQFPSLTMVGSFPAIMVTMYPFFSKIDCNDFSFFRMENLNKDIFWSRFVLKIVAWSAVPGRNRTIAECIARFCIFICTFQINKYLSCNSPAGCIDLGLIFGISKGNLSSMQTSSEPCFS